MIKSSAVSRYRSEAVSSTLRDRAILEPHAEKPVLPDGDDWPCCGCAIALVRLLRRTAANLPARAQQ